MFYDLSYFSYHDLANTALIFRAYWFFTLLSTLEENFTCADSSALTFSWFLCFFYSAYLCCAGLKGRTFLDKWQERTVIRFYIYCVVMYTLWHQLFRVIFFVRIDIGLKRVHRYDSYCSAIYAGRTIGRFSVTLLLAKFIEIQQCK